MAALKDKHIILGVCGGIAAYKSAELARRLYEQGADVQVVMTENAKMFIGPLTFQALTHRIPRVDLWDETAEAGMSHIELAKWADAIVIAPATADCIAKLAHGFAENLLQTLCLATAAPIAVVPAMNQQMWHSLATQKNITALVGHGVSIWGPAEGLQACGDIGPGRMWEPEKILNALEKLFCPPLFANTRILISAGPTREAIDPVRYLSNHSSGKMGFALAEAARLLGAEVQLIAGPVNLPTPRGVKRVDVTSAEEMFNSVQSFIDNIDIFISAAAVAVYLVAEISNQKIKKNSEGTTLLLSPTIDILKWVGAQVKRPFTVGFAAETQALEAHAKEKLNRKNLDMIVANLVGPSKGFNSDYNEATIFWQGGETSVPHAPKTEVAQQIVTVIAQKYGEMYGNSRAKNA